MAKKNFIPSDIGSLLAVPIAGYGPATNIGAHCAGALAEYLRSDPAMIGSNRIGAVAERMRQLVCSDGLEAGFFAVLEHLAAAGLERIDVGQAVSSVALYGHGRASAGLLSAGELKAFMRFLADNPERRRGMLIACGLDLADILEDEDGETPAALAEASSETIVEVRPDLVQVWLTRRRTPTRNADTSGAPV
ncbi:hypothetical protein [Burkholderia cepacia]|uniref:hypothetical protein n=1 Tax=Burkholderia cepacia TaxID=292 RepID=UPI00158B1E0E|nr:hypothetical protein [Burkholderia cepacia]